MRAALRLLAPVLAVATLGCSASAGCGLACSAGSGRDLAVLCGTWQSRGDDGSITEERWFVIDEGLEGDARTLDHEGLLRSHERLTLRHAGAGTIYRAEPDGATPTEFTEVTPLHEPALDAGAGEQVFVWENRAHDFPRRIVYRVAGDRLTATISDPDAADEGQRRGLTWEHQRVSPCAP